MNVTGFNFGAVVFNHMVRVHDVRANLTAPFIGFFLGVHLIFFFVLLAWAGFKVLSILQGMNLVSLPWVPIAFTQSVIPIGAVLFIICQLLSFPNYWSKTIRGISLEHAEIEEEVEKEIEKAKERK